MSTQLTDDELVQALREVLKSKKVSLRDISKDLGVPYRSVQNYIGGETRIPASFFLNLCVYIGLEPDFLATKDFRPREEDLYDAVWNALHQVKLFEDIPHPTREGAADKQESWSENQGKKVALIRKITIIISQQYDRYRREWLVKKDGWKHGRRHRSDLPPDGEVDQ